MLCVFLNDCVQAINSAYDRLANAHPSIGKQKRWYPQLYFHRNEEATVDGIDSAAPLKPDVVGLHEKDFNPKALPCCWGFLDATNPQVRDSGGGEEGAGTYARALRSATLERAFRLVFGYNQATCDFRVLIFHNGGLADAEDAGFPSFTDGDHLALDGSDNTDLHRSSCGHPFSFTDLPRPWNPCNQGSALPSDQGLLPKASHLLASNLKPV
ncbi:hypothetical protein R3P38DRAFT_3241512 [Favolaschia claudopus]|uniref:Uncharacterized protein n=1 Tax=Favolaschia claudopus TaxID=2862362 RepID=A0AAV9Z674_9AGAR